MFLQFTEFLFFAFLFKKCKNATKKTIGFVWKLLHSTPVFDLVQTPSSTYYKHCISQPPTPGFPYRNSIVPSASTNCKLFRQNEHCVIYFDELGPTSTKRAFVVFKRNKIVYGVKKINRLIGKNLWGQTSIFLV